MRCPDSNKPADHLRHDVSPDVRPTQFLSDGEGDADGDDDGVGVGTTAGPTVTVDPVAYLPTVTFFPLSPEANIFRRLYCPFRFAPCLLSFQ